MPLSLILVSFVDPLYVYLGHILEALQGESIQPCRETCLGPNYTLMGHIGLQLRRWDVLQYQ